MHVGLLIPGRLETVSGGYLYDRMLLDHLRQQGVRITLFSRPAVGYRQQLAANVDPALLREIRAATLDFLLQDELAHPSLLWLNRRLRARGGPPPVSIVHHLRSSERHPAPLRPIYRLVERAYLRSVDGFVFNSHTTRQAVAALAGNGARRPGVVAYPAADHRPAIVTEAAIRARALAPGPLRLLFVGNLIPRKGLDLLLDALERLPPAGWRLDVVGAPDVDPAYTRRLRARVRRAGLAGQVSFHGRVADGALPAHFRRAHLLALPSRYEGFGIAYLEGMGYGLPAVAGAGGAAHELVTPGETGFLVGPGEAARLATILATLAADRRRLAQMGVAAYRRHQLHPTWAESVARVRAFLAQRLPAAGGAGAHTAGAETI